ncbi:MAG: hypothetical protein R3D59_06175 [Paracoccaceae bacterium]
MLGEFDEYLLGAGGHRRLWEALGPHLKTIDKVDGTHFAVWAPNAQRVSVVGDFNAWNGSVHPMRRRGSTGVWEIFLPGVGEGATYKYEIRTHAGDPAAQGRSGGDRSEHPPATGSVVRRPGLGRAWKDKAWMDTRAGATASTRRSRSTRCTGSWKKPTRANGLACLPGARPVFVDYVGRQRGFTHIEPDADQLSRSTARGATSPWACTRPRSGMAPAGIRGLRRGGA